MGNRHNSHSYYSVVVYTEITGNEVGVCKYNGGDEEDGCGCKNCMEYEQFQEWYQERSYFLDMLVNSAKEMQKKREREEEEKRVIKECELMQQSVIKDIIEYEILPFIPIKLEMDIESLSELEMDIQSLSDKIDREINNLDLNNK